VGDSWGVAFRFPFPHRKPARPSHSTPGWWGVGGGKKRRQRQRQRQHLEVSNCGTCALASGAKSSARLIFGCRAPWSNF